MGRPKPADSKILSPYSQCVSIEILDAGGMPVGRAQETVSLNETRDHPSDHDT